MIPARVSFSVPFLISVVKRYTSGMLSGFNNQVEAHGGIDAIAHPDHEGIKNVSRETFTLV